MSVELLVGDCRAVMATREAESVQACITSPPYYGLRDYGVDGQHGHEPTPSDYTEALVVTLREARRLLRRDGTLWLNLGDSYAASGGAHGGRTDNQRGVGARRAHLAGGADKRRRRPPHGAKAKDLLGIPWRVALALQADGWYLRSDIIWHKPTRCQRASLTDPHGRTSTCSSSQSAPGITTTPLRSAKRDARPNVTAGRSGVSPRHRSAAHTSLLTQPRS